MKRKEKVAQPEAAGVARPTRLMILREGAEADVRTGWGMSAG